jgi:hypothetical protein
MEGNIGIENVVNLASQDMVLEVKAKLLVKPSPKCLDYCIVDTFHEGVRRVNIWVNIRGEHLT